MVRRLLECESVLRRAGWLAERSGYADGEREAPAYMTDIFEPLASADG